MKAFVPLPVLVLLLANLANENCLTASSTTSDPTTSSSYGTNGTEGFTTDTDTTTSSLGTNSGTNPNASASTSSPATTDTSASTSSTASPDASSTSSTTSPDTSASTSSTASPDASSTNSPTSTDSTTSMNNSTSTDPPTSTDNTTSVNNTTVMTTNLPTTPGTTAAGPSDPCRNNPCKGSSSCVPLNTMYVCLCVEGYYYENETCQKGKTFPGEITVDVSETSDLENKTSSAYENLHHNVTEFFKDAFNSNDYGQTVILKVRSIDTVLVILSDPEIEYMGGLRSTSPSRSARSELLTAGNAVVKVVNIFLKNSNITASDVAELIENATSRSSFVKSYTAQSLCDFYGCVKENEDDDCTDGLTCTCKEGLERPNILASFCVATCPSDCNAENNKQCLMTKEDEKPTCVCLAGYRNNSGICQKCSFGYGGVNCENPFQLILTIVGSIAGFLILVLMIAVICSARSKNKGKNIEEQNLIDNDFHGLKLQQTTGFTNMGAEGAFFPRVKTGASQNVHPQNPYSNPIGLPGRDY